MHRSWEYSTEVIFESLPALENLEPFWFGPDLEIIGRANYYFGGGEEL